MARRRRRRADPSHRGAGRPHGRRRRERHRAHLGHDDGPADDRRARRRRARRHDRVDRRRRPCSSRPRRSSSAERATSGWRSSRPAAPSPTGRCRCCSTRTAVPTSPRRPEGAHAAARVAVVRGPGLRGAGDRRAGHARVAGRAGTARSTGTSPDPVLEDQVDGLACRGRDVSVPRPRAGRDPRLVVRRVPRGDGGAPPARRLPCGGERRAGHGRRAVRHALHRAVPGDARRRARGVRPVSLARRRAEPRAAAAAHPRARRRQRLRREHAAAVEGAAGGRPAPLGDPALGHHARAEPAGGRPRTCCCSRCGSSATRSGFPIQT